MRMRSPGTRGVLALLAGALPAPAFPAPALWWLAPVALVPWLLLARSAPSPRAAAATGWLGGAGFMLAVHHWLLPSLHVFLVLLAALLGLLWAPWGWTVRRLLGGVPGPGRLAAAVFLVPSAWLLAELVRSWEYLGGPWGLLGATQWQVPQALRLASVGGVWLVGFVLVAVNVCAAVLLAVPTARLPALAALAAAGLIVPAVDEGAPRVRPSGTLRVALVQPGTAGPAGARLERSERLTRALARSAPDLVVWGESSVRRDLTGDPGLRARLARLSSRVGARILVNVDARRAGAPGIRKTSVLVGPGGPVGAHYDKRRLVPFGEYVPARAVLGWATQVGKAAGEDRQRGGRPVLMESAGRTFAPLICFETAFPDMSRQLVGDGAELLVGQTSTSSFQESWAPQQHASLAALRAAETGRPVVHATLTGESAAFGPAGEPTGPRLDTDRTGTAVHEVTLATGSTPYVRYGDWVVQLGVAGFAAFCTVELLRTRGVRRGGGAGAPAPALPEETARENTHR